MSAPRPVALITGSGRKRIGYVIAKDLAAAGYDVAIHYHSSKAAAEATLAELRALGADAEAFGADLTNENDIDRLFGDLARRFGRLDLFVATAATWKPIPLEETTAKDLRDFWEVNTLGSFLTAQKAGLLMTQQPTGGAIVLIGDWAVHRPYPNYAAYFASKGAIETMTRTLAVELGQRNPNVRVNAILPGPVMLPSDMSEAERREVIAATLVKREGRPEHVAHAVRFLASNDFLTGVCLPVDGGRTIYAGGM